ncbi:MAG: hypothetical protein ABI947_19250 [Chloroflexota bacterium]
MSTERPLVYSCRQYRLLIAGSRQATEAMLHAAYKAVVRARANGWAIHVGDAQGVDAAVVAACNELGVNYVCFGLGSAPRNSQVSGSVTGRYWRVAPDKAKDYAARDRVMVDCSDRGLFIWNGQSKGTLAGHTYMQQLGKPVDLLTFGEQAQVKEQETQAKSPDKPCVPHPAVVEVILDTTLTDTAQQGIFGLRALDATGAVLYQKRVEVAHLDTTTADYAKLQVLITALDTLKGRLKGSEAVYTLRVVQSSKNVEGWLGKQFKRNMPQVKALGSTADELLKAFPSVEWVKMPRAQIVSALSKIR